MFSKPYQGIKYFGHLAEEQAERFGRRDALAVLEDAQGRCLDEDMRTADVFAALDYLKPQAVRKWPFRQFRLALDLSSPDMRLQSITASMQAIRRAFDQ